MHGDAMNDSDPGLWRARMVLSCLGVASRFRLVQALAEEDRCVGELAVVVGLSQSCTTRHLQALEQAGLVRGHREGRRVRFRLRTEAPGLGVLLRWAFRQGEADSLLAGGDLHFDRRPLAGAEAMAAASPAGGPMTAGRTGPAQPVSGVRRRKTESNQAPGPREGGPGPSSEDHVRGPLVRPGDLEDYLL
jgi:DNA-binding transcriptional ArsR family regulator